MPLTDPLDQEIRSALEPRRPPPEAFEQGVRQRLASDGAAATPEPQGASGSRLRDAASFIPLPLLLGAEAPREELRRQLDGDPTSGVMVSVALSRGYLGDSGSAGMPTCPG